jgi:hypothetical protein
MNVSKHYCVALILRNGQQFWGKAREGPCCDPIPPEVLERHPDVLLDWALCSKCGEPICGKPAPFAIRGEEGEETIWLCAEHYDESVNWRWPNWHEHKVA